MLDTTVVALRRDLLGRDFLRGDFLRGDFLRGDLLPRDLLPVAAHALRLPGAGVSVPPGVTGPRTSDVQVECARDRAYRRQHATTSVSPATAWPAAGSRFPLPSGESSASSPPV